MTWVDIEQSKEPIRNSRALEIQADRLFGVLPKKNKRKSQASQKVVVRKYEDYINSTEWRARTLAYWKSHIKRCEACGARDRITLHHTHYGYLGRERDEHLTPLCWSCHKAFHDKHGTKTVMQEETAEFIADIKMGGHPIT